ncbi:MAG TPA: 1-(5-phosphoribosyl)-5-[(5-phosphoribosylamino)methylideneamino]imidazole-4-carboxamide isomerase [Candidatus Omnitrophota bacterium]|nr:1-(5-phosphoribosyl)-5-[(5-phosphoribosylamino)methylideneamino]imidazole-4-carboxamide isomerase [Candidatus Omnitrophota bacterium]HRZ15617.1 1-(5-phosphoribosyl)-5-[(5-phosphoribosylamino)methylideneamino]imidazole-4-carboxamide isomerase [Candidatus Omnitrophota bacterium]
MLIIPAIDLKDGKVVRLYQGRSDERVYSDDAAAVAKEWQRQGAQMLHVVDLDGAFSGSPKNLSALTQILRAVTIPVEFGGGVRDKQTILNLFAAGVHRVVLGTRAVQDRAFLQDVFSQFRERVIVSIDAKHGMVLIEGWQKESPGIPADTFALQLRAMGFREVIYTDTLKDGALSGPNLPALADLALKTGLQVIASGGISALADLDKLKKMEKSGVIGVIIGKALYEGKFTVQQALEHS